MSLNDSFSFPLKCKTCYLLASVVTSSTFCPYSADVFDSWVVCSGCSGVDKGDPKTSSIPSPACLTGVGSLCLTTRQIKETVDHSDTPRD